MGCVDSCVLNSSLLQDCFDCGFILIHCWCKLQRQSLGVLLSDVCTQGHNRQRSIPGLIAAGVLLLIFAYCHSWHEGSLPMLHPPLWQAGLDIETITAWVHDAFTVTILSVERPPHYSDFAR